MSIAHLEGNRSYCKKRKMHVCADAFWRVPEWHTTIVVDNSVGDVTLILPHGRVGDTIDVWVKHDPSITSLACVAPLDWSINGIASYGQKRARFELKAPRDHPTIVHIIVAPNNEIIAAPIDKVFAL